MTRENLQARVVLMRPVFTRKQSLQKLIGNGVSLAETSARRAAEILDDARTDSW